MSVNWRLVCEQAVMLHRIASGFPKPEHGQWGFSSVTLIVLGFNRVIGHNALRNDLGVEMWGANRDWKSISHLELGGTYSTLQEFLNAVKDQHGFDAFAEGIVPAQEPVSGKGSA